VRKSGGVVVLCAQPVEDLEAVEPRHHDVEDEGVGTELAHDAEGGLAVGRRADVPALVAQRHPEQVGEALLVVDHEHADG
jgi:hypothetical protein